MAYKFNINDMPPAKPLPKKTGGYTFNINDMPPAKPMPSAAQNFIGGAVNPVIGLVKDALAGGRKFESGLLQDVQGTQGGQPGALSLPAPQQMSKVDTTEGLPRTLGNVASYLPVFGGLEKVGARGLQKVASKVPKLLRDITSSSAAGGATGALMAPSGQRKGEAIGGAIGGGGGAVVGKLLSKAGSSLMNTAKFENTKKALLKMLPKDLSDHAHADVINDIIENYQNARNTVRPMYQSLWDDLKGGGLGKDEMTSLKGVVDKDTKSSRDPLMDVSKDSLSTTGEGKFDPEQLHYLQSDLLRKAGMADRRGDAGNKILYSKYGNAIKADLARYLEKNNLNDRYKNAQSTWKKTLLPYKESRPFKQIAPHIEGKSQDLEGAPLSDTDMDLFKNTAQTSKLANQFMPSSTVKDVGRFNELTKLLGGDKNLAQAHLKNMVLAKHMTKEGLDFPSLLKHVEGGAEGSANKGLPQDQKDFIFPKEEQHILRQMHGLKGSRVSPHVKRHIAGALTAALVHHVVPGANLALAWLGGYGLEPALEKGLGNTLGSAPMRALAKSSVSPQQVIAPSASFVGAKLGGRQ